MTQAMQGRNKRSYWITAFVLLAAAFAIDAHAIGTTDDGLASLMATEAKIRNGRIAEAKAARAKATGAPSNTAPDPTVTDPVDVATVGSASNGGAVVRVTNTSEWTLVIQLYITGCVNMITSECGRSTPFMASLGPRGGRVAPMIFAEDSSKPFSFQYRVDYRYVKGNYMRGPAGQASGTPPVTDQALTAPAPSTATAPAARVVPPAQSPAPIAAAKAPAAIASAQPGSNCGKSGEIININMLKDIPAVCQAGRQNNYAYNNSENDGVTFQTLCKTAIDGENNNGRWKNLSGCFCGKKLLTVSGDLKPATCWVLYET